MRDCETHCISKENHYCYIGGRKSSYLPNCSHISSIHTPYRSFVCIRGYLLTKERRQPYGSNISYEQTHSIIGGYEPSLANVSPACRLSNWSRVCNTIRVTFGSKLCSAQLVGYICHIKYDVPLLVVSNVLLVKYSVTYLQPVCFNRPTIPSSESVCRAHFRF